MTAKINIIGLGSAGCNLAEEFKKYPQYKVYKIDTEGKKEANFYMLKSYNHPELYEKNPPRLKTFFRGMTGEVLFILSGSGICSGAALVILEQIKHCDIAILYIKPDVELLGELKQTQEKIVYNVLQEYTRSGVFKEMILMSNPVLETILGNIPLTKYYAKLNEMIVSSVHMINVFKNSSSYMDSFSEPRKSSRLITIGAINLNNGEEKTFFSLDKIDEKMYYYGISKETLENDITIFKNIKEQIKNKITGFSNVSYGIYQLESDYNCGFFVTRSSEIQGNQTQPRKD